VYIPEIGYLLGLPMWKEEMTEEDLELPGLDFMVSSNFDISILLNSEYKINKYCNI
jgi:hypothetical protein